MRKTLVISLLFTFPLLILTVISAITYNHQSNDEVINKVKNTQRQQQLQQQRHISQQINHTISRFKQLNTYLQQQSWQQTLTLAQRNDFIKFSNNMLANNHNLNSINLIDYKNSYRLQITTTADTKTSVLDNKPILSETELNNIDHAFSLPPDKTYITTLPFPINHIAYYQHITVNDHQWIVKIEQRNLPLILTTLLASDSLPIESWIINNKGQTLINIKQKNTSHTNSEKDFKNKYFSLWQQIQRYNHRQIIEDNILYTYSPFFIPKPLKEKVDFKYGNLSPWILVSKVNITDNHNHLWFIQKPLNPYFYLCIVIMIICIGIILTLCYIERQKKRNKPYRKQ
ncbi:hypothetical protein [Photobacterium kishitanii]|uniref:hypothetical protein n=1 Tax=Photobacterium kishitanii TaxID=318456 RepID=UPI0007F8A3AD|nr:hypothetical protein [Photobacterium kishitanii]OBU28054.1 hypothetical protein AYY23_08470 [Photobacterium kishitanii]